MGFELNSKAYNYFIQIEVGIREFLIDLISDQGIKQWMTGFLGFVQRDTIQEISIRIAEAKKNEQMPSIEDLYISKLNRAKREAESSLTNSQLYHPFYYLNWTDLDLLISMRSNSILIENVIGKTGRESISYNLKLINNLRNDIAHSRFILDNDFEILRTCFDQISQIIPRFAEFIKTQTNEDKLGYLLNELEKKANEILGSSMLSIDEIKETIVLVNKCLNSFWLNSLAPEIIVKLESFSKELVNYAKYRQIPGGLLQIQKWKSNNKGNLMELINIIKNGKI